MFNPGTVERVFAQLDLEVPEALATVGAIRRALNEAATSDPVAELNAELFSGKVNPRNAKPKAEAVATRLVVREKCHEVTRDLQPGLDRLERRTLIESGDEIILALRPVFDEQAATLAVVFEQLGPRPSQTAIMNAGPAAVAAWEQREIATRTLALIRRARVQLGDVGYGNDHPQASEAPWWIAPPSNAADLTRATEAWNGQGPGVVNLADAGFALRLNTADETHAALLDGVRLEHEAEEAEQRAQAEAEKRDRIAEAQRHYDTNLEQTKKTLTTGRGR